MGGRAHLQSSDRLGGTTKKIACILSPAFFPSVTQQVKDLLRESSIFYLLRGVWHPSFFSLLSSLGTRERAIAVAVSGRNAARVVKCAPRVLAGEYRGQWSRLSHPQRRGHWRVCSSPARSGVPLGKSKEPAMSSSWLRRCTEPLTLPPTHRERQISIPLPQRGCI